MWSYEHERFTVHQLPALSDNYIYLIDMPDAGILAAVDPAEAKTVIQACNQIGRKLSHILNTHHHWDHVGGNLELKERYACTIIGPSYDAERIPGIDVEASEEKPVQLSRLEMSVLFVPGHTRGHIAYVFDDALFCGDTLFGAGCGRLFEGTPEQMWNSLNKLFRLRGDTRFYCAHEYTLSNLKFSISIDPDNADLKERISTDSERQRQGMPTIPSTLAMELATNPFLRPLNREFRQTYAGNHGLPDDAVSIFTHIRAAKDRW